MKIKDIIVLLLPSVMVELQAGKKGVIPLRLEVGLGAAVVVVIVERPESESGDVDGAECGGVARRHHRRGTVAARR